MYCTRCGKKIDYDSFVCNECRAAEDALVGETKLDDSKPATEVNVEPESTVTETETPREQPAPNQQYYYSTQNTGYAQYQNPYTEQPAPVQTGNPRMIGFGKALTSTILSFFGYIFSYVALLLAVDGEPAGGLVMLLIALGMSIPALILGIQSIKTSARVASQGLPRPIATLVLGIVGLAFSALALFFSFITFIIVGAA